MTEQVKNLYNQGKTSQEIAVFTGLSLNQVNRIIYVKLGLQSKIKKMTMKEIKQVNDLKSKGFCRKLICKRLDISLDRHDKIIAA